jgi:hypothetical protein
MLRDREFLVVFGFELFAGFACYREFGVKSTRRSKKYLHQSTIVDAVNSKALPFPCPAAALPLPFLSLPSLSKTLALRFPSVGIYLPCPA